MLLNVLFRMLSSFGAGGLEIAQERLDALLLPVRAPTRHQLRVTLEVFGRIQLRSRCEDLPAKDGLREIELN